MRTVTFIRHGESTGNAGMTTRDPSQIELTEKGRRQAEELARLWTKTPALIVTSPYLRARLTAQPTIDRFPVVAVEQWPVHEFTYLEPGRWNGTSRDSRLPTIEAYWRAADPGYRDGPGAESFSNLLRRAENALNTLDSLPNDSPVFVFTHGQFMQAVRLTLCCQAATDREKMARFLELDRECPICNCAMFQAESTGCAAWQLIEYPSAVVRL